MSKLKSVVIVHITKGDMFPEYYVVGGEEVRLFIVDENSPNDRVYEWLHRDPPEKFREIIPAGSTIGSCADDRHEAIANKINALRDGKSPFTVVDGGKSG